MKEKTIAIIEINKDKLPTPNFLVTFDFSINSSPQIYFSQLYFFVVISNIHPNPNPNPIIIPNISHLLLTKYPITLPNNPQKNYLICPKYMNCFIHFIYLIIRLFFIFLLI